MIYLHRANSLADIQKAIELKIGIEVDIRTHLGIPYLSHDPIISPSDCLAVLDLVKIIEIFKIPTILDFKESGIIPHTLKYLNSKDHYIATDLIYPDQLVCKAVGLRTLSRNSPWEQIKDTAYGGFWVDYLFDSAEFKTRQLWKNCCWGEGLYLKYLVSPELHKQPLTQSYISEAYKCKFDGICTDFPEMWIYGKEKETIKGTT